MCCFRNSFDNTSVKETFHLQAAHAASRGWSDVATKAPSVRVASVGDGAASRKPI